MGDGDHIPAAAETRLHSALSDDRRIRGLDLSAGRRYRICPRQERRSAGGPLHGYPHHRIDRQFRRANITGATEVEPMAHCNCRGGSSLGLVRVVGPGEAHYLRIRCDAAG